MTHKKLLFVCMGNSCCSPMAETIMQNLMVKTSLYWEVDSAALRTWNIGRRPHAKCQRILKEHGLRSDHFCRLLSIQDFYYFDYIITMNPHVHKVLLNWMAANHVDRISKVIQLSTYDKNGKSIINLSPGHKIKFFRNTYYQIKECCKQLILGQQVNIVRYNLPSSDDEDLQEYVKFNFNKPEEPSDVQAYSNIDCKQQSPSKSPLKSCSVCSMPKSLTKKLCQKCGKKFLANL